ncbi:MAG: acyltransferase [Clostridium sp.]|nr:acyltransferase [Clostridium sp.]
MMIYALYVVLAIILVAGVKFAGIKDCHDDFIGLNQSKAIQGISAILIIVHHLSQRLQYAKPLQFFVDSGILFVGIFFFCSGYGLIKSLRQKPDYLKHFLKKRMITILVPFYVINLIFLVYAFATGRFDSLKGAELAKELFFRISGIKLLNSNAWYVVVIAILYVVFYVVFRFLNEKLAFVLMLLTIIGMQLLGLYIDHGDWWFQGEWWYNTTILFYIGMLFARFEAPLVKGIKKIYYLLLPVAVLCFVLMFRYSNTVLYKISYWCEYNPALSRKEIFCGRATILSTQIVATVLFVLVILLVSMKLHFHNPVLGFIGAISFELYLIHDLFLEFYQSKFIYLSKEVTYVYAVIGSAIVAATLLWLIISRLNAKLLKTKKQ